MRVRNVKNIENACRNVHFKLRKLLLEQTNLEDACNLAQFLGSFAYRNHYGLYQDFDVEKHIYRLASSLGKVSHEYEADTEIPNNILHVMTKANLSGGHTRVLENWCVIGQNEFYHDVVVTSQGNDLVPEKLREVARSMTFLPQDSWHKKAMTLAKYFTKANVIVLHIHPYDVLPTVAAALVDMRSKKIALYDHGDHAFTYGYHISNLVYEISGFGHELTKAKKYDGKRRYYLGIPLVADHAVKLNFAERKNGYFLSAGSAYKYHPVPGLDFIAFAKSLVEKTKQRLIIIGPDKHKEPHWMNVFSSTNGLVDAIGGVEYGKFVSMLDGAKCYIDSFPFTGGTAFTEVLLKGVPIFGMKLPCTGYSCLDVIRVNSTADLEDRLVKYHFNGDDEYIRELSHLQLQVIQLQGTSGFMNRFKDSLSKEAIALEAGIPYTYQLQDLSHFERKWQNEKVVIIENKLLPSISLLTIRLLYIFAASLGYSTKMILKMLLDSIRK